MPELPEVETIVNNLAPLLQGKKIIDVKVEWPRVLGSMPLDEFHRGVVGHRFEGVSRRGKYILASLSGGVVLTFHLRMTGQLLFRSAGSPPDRFVRAIFLMDGGDELRFADARKFGCIRILDETSLRRLENSLGYEPLGPQFTLDAFANLLRKHSTRIKTLLLDQRFVAGIGNIYADEALFEAGIHPMRAAGSLSAEEIRRLYDAVRFVLRSSIANRGTTFSTYRDALGQMGANQFSLRVYRRHGMPCAKCGTPLERIVVGGRGTHFCPRCQPESAARPRTD